MNKRQLERYGQHQAEIRRLKKQLAYTQRAFQVLEKSGCVFESGLSNRTDRIKRRVEILSFLNREVDAFLDRLPPFEQGILKRVYIYQESLLKAALDMEMSLGQFHDWVDQLIARDRVFASAYYEDRRNQ